ncbi:MAG: hypothetical protein MJ071_00240 [Oscillospiraceae bacterium]|nr:hypothetical protein [Oscillospiraceae bacterium]
MKKKICLAACAVLVSGVCLAGCGTTKNTPVNEDSEPETTKQTLINDEDGKDDVLEMPNGSTVVVTDDGSVITETSDGCTWSYLAGTCTMNFPTDWKDRVVVRGTTVYVKKCFEAVENTGALFSIEFCEDKDLQSMKPIAVFGWVSNKYVIVTAPDAPDYDTNSTELNTEYESMKAQLNDVLKTAHNSDAPDFKAVNLIDYVSASECNSALSGTWNQQNIVLETGFVPYMTFRASDSTFGYRLEDYKLGVGTYFVNKNAENYVWNTDNWGDAAVLFSHGKVYRVTYYETTPRTMDVETIYSPYDESDQMVSQNFDYASENQVIKLNENNEEEVKLS